MNKFGLSLIAATLLAACSNLAPDYHRPALPVPGNWPDKTQSQVQSTLPWRNFLTAPKLQKIVGIALQNNRDLRIAALNIEKSQAQYQIEQASLFPHINATASDNATLTPANLSTSHARTVSHVHSAGLGFSAYELDFFGRVRNLKEMALEQYLNTEQAHRSVEISLLAQVTTAYLTLAADQQHLALAALTLQAQQTTLTMIQRRFTLGVSSQLDLNQAQMMFNTARGDVARYTGVVAQDINALTLLAGVAIPDELLPHTALADSVSDISPGLPSDLLQNRPDILQAEHQLKAANANIGIARAAFFPSISLTTSFGTSSNQLNGLFKSASRAWQFAPQLNLPIFDGGSNTASLKSARAEQKIYLAQYEKSIQAAFREVADALADHDSLTEQLAAQQALVDASALSFKLSQARFNKGVDSYLAVLDSQRSLYTAEHALINLKLAQSNNRVTLYKALGGGSDDLQVTTYRHLC